MTNIDTRFISDIDPDPEFIETMCMSIDDGLIDSIEDFAWQIATDYVPAPDFDPGDSTAQQEFEDRLFNTVISPLRDHLMRRVLIQALTNYLD